jgi:hypothetical protein
MMNEETKGALGYDPCDQNSFPYQADDPPFGPHRLVIEDPARAAQVDYLEPLHTLSCTYGDDGPSEYRTLDMALRCFAAVIKDSAFAEIPYPDLFAACLDQALVWERG